MSNQRKITESILRYHLLDIVKIYRIVLNPSYELFEHELASLDEEGIRIVQSIYWIGRCILGKRPRKNGYKLVNSYMDDDTKENIVYYITGKRLDGFFQ